MKILAVDPGKVTGFALWDGEKVVQVEELMWLRFLEAMETDVYRRDALGVYAPTITEIVCEDYRVTIQTLKKTWQPYSLYQIGTLMFWAGRSGIPFTLQTAGEAKEFMTNDRLRRLGWWQSGTAGHGNDALRHLGLYLAKTGRLDLELLRGDS